MAGRRVLDRPLAGRPRHRGHPAPDWSEALPQPPDVVALAAPPPPLALPGLPASLQILLEDTIGAWAADVTKGRVAEVAQLTGWTEEQVLACTGSYLTMPGEHYMRPGVAGKGES